MLSWSIYWQHFVAVKKLPHRFGFAEYLPLIMADELGCAAAAITSGTIWASRV